MYSEHIKKRHRLWWGRPRPRSLRGFLERLHRLQERLTYRDCGDAEPLWKCCEAWQRLLSNKWNARQFAQRHGYRVPELYWSGRRPGRLPLDRLPESYAIRPFFGHSGEGIYLISEGYELFSETPCTRDELRARLLKSLGRVSRVPLLAEEFIEAEEGPRLFPVNYKAYVFGETIGALQVVRNNRHRFYTPDWEPFPDPMNTVSPTDVVHDPPRFLDEVLDMARELGKAYGAHVRVDILASRQGCVFGEFSGTPYLGTGFTPFADEYFEALWQEHLGERI